MFYLVVCSNLLYWYKMGFHAVVVLPLLWVGSIAVEMFLQISGKKHKRRMLTYVSLAMCVLCEILMWVLQGSYVAYAFYLSYHIAAAVFLGSLLGKVGYAVMERVQTRKRNKEE